MDMAYEATVWNTGDAITAEKLNKLEAGVQNEQIGPQGPQGEPGAAGPQGESGEDGVRGSRWNAGTAISGGSGITAQVFAESGITDALPGDRYLNTSDGSVYVCVTGGAAAAATWTYEMSLKGPAGENGEDGAPGTGLTGAAASITKLAGTEEAAAIATKVNEIIDDLIARGICTAAE